MNKTFRVSAGGSSPGLTYVPEPGTPRRRLGDTMSAHRARSSVLAACLAALLVAAQAPAGAAEFTHYPGSFLDSAQTRQSSRGGSVFATQDRFDRVAAFYGQHLVQLPAASGALFCLDRVDNASQCRRFVELVDLSPGGVGTRILVYGRD